MAIQLSLTVRNSRLDAIEGAIGTSAVLKIRTGAAPTSTGAADTGTALATMSLAANWMADAANGSKGLAGTWQCASASGAGTAAHFRIYASDGTTCHLQGTVGQGSGDLSLDNSVIAAGQQVNVTAFTLTDANA